MRTRAVLSSIFASVGILVVGWQVGAASAMQSATVSATASSGTTDHPSTPADPTTPTSADATTPTSAATPAAPAPSSDGTWTGSSVNTRFGPVQVKVTISNGSITEVAALQLTDADGRSVQISNQAAPMLRQEVLAGQSANVSNIGGATYTSQAYLGSVQSALDQAGF